MSIGTLTKREAIAAHKALWNWIADTISTTGTIPEKTEFAHSGFPDINECAYQCYICEYAKQQTKTEKLEDMCKKCLLEWPHHLDASTQDSPCACTNNENQGLYNQYTQQCRLYNQKQEKEYLENANRIARQIANLPERTLTKEQAIKAHRALWNWIADETKRTGYIPRKADFKDSDYPNIRNCTNQCYVCDYATTQVLKEEPYLPYVDIELRCPNCPLQWPDEFYNNDSSDNFKCCTNEDYSGLYDEWCDLKQTQTNITKAVEIARQIANLPEN